MKKEFWTTVVMACFSIAFTASIEDEKAEEKASVNLYTAEEGDKESNPNDEVITTSTLSPKEQEIADDGYEAGSIFGMVGGSLEGLSSMINTVNYINALENKPGDAIRKIAGDDYDKKYQVPSNATEEKHKKIYVDNYIRGMNKAIRAFQN